MEQNRETRISPCIYGQLIIYKVTKNIQRGKDSLFNKIVLEKLDIHIQKIEIKPSSYTTKKISSKWIRDLNVISETIKFLEENRVKLLDIGLGTEFLGYGTKNVCTIKYIQGRHHLSKKLFHSKKRSTKWEKIFTDHISNKGLLSKTCKVLILKPIKFNRKNAIINNQISWYIFFQRMYSNGQQIHEKVFNIPNHHGNTNQNHDVIPSHICQNGYYQKKSGKFWWECGEKGIIV